MTVRRPIAQVAGVLSVLPPGDTLDPSCMPGAASPNHSWIRNGNFAISQRAVSGTVTLAAGAYGHDRWKAGASGCTYTFVTAASGDTTLTITAGTLIQVIEGVLYVKNTAAVLSWNGTSTGRVYQGAATGSYATSPVLASSLTAGTNTTVEFSTGTLSLAKMEYGSTATAFEYCYDELWLCQRYYELITLPTLQSPAANVMAVPWSFKVQKRAAPTLATVSGPTYSGASGASAIGGTVDGMSLQFTASTAGGNVAGWVVSANSEL